MSVAVTLAQRSTLGAPPAVLVTITATGEPNNSIVDLFRVHPDGSEHRVVLTERLRLLPLANAAYDYHPPYNVPIRYRAQLVSSGSSGTSLPTRVISNRSWLIHSSQVTRSVRIEGVRAFGDRTRDSHAAGFRPWGGRTSFQTDGVRGGLTGSILIRTTDLEALDLLLSDDQVVLIDTPGRIQRYDIGWLWCQPGQIGYNNPVHNNTRTYELVNLPFVESEDPEVDLISLWTAGAAADYWAAQGINAGQLATKYATALDYATDTRL